MEPQRNLALLFRILNLNHMQTSHHILGSTGPVNTVLSHEIAHGLWAIQGILNILLQTSESRKYKSQHITRINIIIYILIVIQCFPGHIFLVVCTHIAQPEKWLECLRVHDLGRPGLALLALWKHCTVAWKRPWTLSYQGFRRLSLNILLLLHTSEARLWNKSKSK